MNYFSKIEAYFLGELQEEEHRLFEEELATNMLLQKEVEAYELAQDLFGFTATHLSEETIIATDAKETVEALINFTANHLSEEQILATTPVVEQAAITRTLQPRKNRSAWLVAASMLLILSLIGTQFYLTQGRQEGNIEGVIANTSIKAPTSEVVAPVEKITVPTPEKELIVSKEATKKPAKTNSVKVLTTDKKVVPMPQNIAVVNIEKEEKIAVSKKPITKVVAPLETNITAQEITTGKIIDSGASVVYNSTNAVTLKAGFYAKVGATFTATTTDLVNHSANSVIDSEESVVYSASETITLKADFTAKTKEAFNKDISIEAVIAPEETIVFKASNTITFKPGFHVKPGATLIASVGE